MALPAEQKPASVVRWYPFDRMVVGYSLLMVLIMAIMGRPLREFYGEFFFYGSTAALAFIMVRYLDESRGGLQRFLRICYPAILFTFFYRATGGLMFLVHDRFLDHQLIALEETVFGIEPTLYIDRHLLNPVVNEILSFCYFSYYFMIIVFLLMLYLKKDFAVIKSFLSAACATFFFSYLLFFLYPLEGPRWYLANQYLNPIDGYWFRSLTQLAIAVGAVRGGCMPSTHFAVALVILMYVYRHYRRAAWWLTLLVIGLGLGTVWGRYHYVSDVFIGGLIGLSMTLLVWKYFDFSGSSGYNVATSKEIETENVS